MKILFLGTGTSTGIPQIGCACEVCRSADERDKRFRSSVLVQTGNSNLLIDCGPDFREQMVRNNISHLEGIVLTHEHYDHVSGLDEVRPLQQVEVYAEERVLAVVKRNLHYVFSENPYPGAPKINLHQIEAGNEPFVAAGFTIQAIRLYHHKLPVLGYRIGNFAYLTDMSTLDDSACEKLQQLDVLALVALRQFPHPAHMMLSESLTLIDKLKPKRTYLIHMSHDMGLHEVVQKSLPENVFLAWDGLEIELESKR